MTSESATTKIDGSDESESNSLRSTINVNSESEVESESINVFLSDVMPFPVRKKQKKLTH
jgi:hypothetical protein